MNTHHEKERVQKTTVVYLVVMALVVVLILIAIPNTTFKAIASILVVLICAIAIIIQWMLLGKRPESDQAAVKPAEIVEQKGERVSTQTGAPCEVGGQYHCSEHPERKVSMEEGKRFPPCRGDNRGHSATWILEA
jgi:hypothetical protein